MRSFILSEITNRFLNTKPKNSNESFITSEHPFYFGTEKQISKGWEWLGKDTGEQWLNKNMSHYSFGTCCVGRNDELFFVFRKGFTHGVIESTSSDYYNIGGDLYYTVSYDYGETWSDPVLILKAETGRDLRDVSLWYNKDCDYYVFIYTDRNVDYNTNKGTMHIMSTKNVERASEGIATDPFPLTNMTDWVLPTSDMFALNNQTFTQPVAVGNYLYITFYGYDTAGSDSKTGAGLLRFNRDGSGGTVVHKWDIDYSNESTFFVTYNENNTIRFNMLFRGGLNENGDIATYSYSDDCGITWSEKESLGFQAAGGPRVYTINNTLMLVARDQSQPNAVHMYAMFSKDGKNWSDRIFLTDLGVSYSSLAQFKNGKTIIAYCKELNKCKLYIRDVYKIPNLDNYLA